MEPTVDCYPPDRQGQGRGTTLLHHVKQTLAVSGGHMLLVEMSELPDFGRTRAFYRKCDYDEEARIRDFCRTHLTSSGFCFKVLKSV